MTTDLTKGSPFKQILFFSIPFLIGRLFQLFYNIADMVIVGYTLDTSAYAAIGATASLIWFAGGAVQSLTIGLSMITAQYFGAKDEEGVKRSFAASIKLSLIISIVITVVCTIFSYQILEWMQTPADIIQRSHAYIFWIFLGLISTAVFNLLSNMIRALGDSKTPLYFLVITCLVNIVLDVVLITLCGMDTDGAGLATVISQLLSAILCAIYIKKKLPLLHPSFPHFKTDRTLDLRLLKVAMPMAAMDMVLSIGGIVMQFVTNSLGTLYVAAQTTGDKLAAFITQPLISFGSAFSVFASQNYGAGKYRRITVGARKTMLIAILWCCLVAIVMIPFGKPLIRLITGNVEAAVVDNAYLYILVAIILSAILVPLIIFKSLLQALGRTVWTLVSGFTEILARAGLSLTVSTLLNASVIDMQTAFFMMCFNNPLAWLFGLLTVLADYILANRLLKRLQIKQEQEEQATSDEM